MEYLLGDYSILQMGFIVSLWDFKVSTAKSPYNWPWDAMAFLCSPGGGKKQNEVKTNQGVE